MVDYRLLLQSYMPSYKIVIISCTKEQHGFWATFRMTIETKAEAEEWLREYSTKTMSTFLTLCSFDENTDRIVFKRRYRCMHNTQRRLQAKKNPSIRHNSKDTGCGAKILITVKTRARGRSKDPFLKEYPTVVHLRHTHNHSPYDPKIMKHRRRTKEIEEIFIELFMKGYSPTTALELHKIHLQQKYEDSDLKIMDGSFCPPRDWCYKLYKKLFNKQFVEATVPDLMTSLVDFVSTYNEACNETCAVFSYEAEASGKSDIIISFCTPLMKRIHKYIHTWTNVVFIDASANVNQRNCRVYLILCASVAGALPLGIFVTNSKSDSASFDGLLLSKQFFPDNSIFAETNPNIIITNDSATDWDSLKTMFEGSNLLLCQFHVLKVFHRHIWYSKFNIRDEDRIYIYQIFRNLVHIRDESEFVVAFSSAFEDPVFKKYDKLIKHLKELQLQSHRWALCYRTHLLTESNHTNNFLEAGFCVLKDNLLSLTTKFSMLQMCSFITDILENYYTQKLKDVVNIRYDSYTPARHITDKDVGDSRCERLSNQLFSVTSKNVRYTVNVELDICSCPRGQQGPLCRHLCAVIKHFELPVTLFSPNVVSIFEGTKVLRQVLEEEVVPEDEVSENDFAEQLSDENMEDVEPVIMSDDELTQQEEIEDNLSENCAKEETDVDVNKGMNDALEYLKMRFECHAKAAPGEMSHALREFLDAARSMKSQNEFIMALKKFGK